MGTGGLGMLTQLIPITSTAVSFTGRYGDLFSTITTDPAVPSVTVQSVKTNELLTVARRPEGIYVNGRKFCTEW
jgi:hypothetical protein